MPRYGHVYVIEYPGDAYVGSALGRCFGRWSEHFRRLTAGNHHCKELQIAFTSLGETSLAFRILESGVHEEMLLAREALWTRTLNGVNAFPVPIVRGEKRAAILDAIRRRVPYRRITRDHSVSLGAINSNSTAGRLGGASGRVHPRFVSIRDRRAHACPTSGRAAFRNACSR